MKKSVFLCALLLLFCSQYEYHDLSSYKSDNKSIEVKGEVEEAGVIEVARDATIEDILNIISLTEIADISSLNLTLNLENHSVLVIPAKTEKKKISINGGTLEELDSLSGIGPVVAQRIIEYRSSQPFQKLEDLKDVKGIGDKLFDKIKDEIQL